MKISKTWLAVAIAIACSSALSAQSVSSTLPKDSTTESLQKIDSATSGVGIRVSKLIGMKIQNSNKENVGQIKDIVIDPASTRVQYVAVTYGGFLGLGDKLFAVPMRAIQVKQDPDSRDRVVLVLDVTKEQMQGAQGFDEENWPDFSDDNFSGEIHRRYNVIDNWAHAIRDGGVDVQVGRGGVKVNVDGLRK